MPPSFSFHTAWILLPFADHKTPARDRPRPGRIRHLPMTTLVWSGIPDILHGTFQFCEKIQKIPHLGIHDVDLPGLGERVIYRELFPSGLTLLDKGMLGDLGISHIAARQELREMVAGLQLPKRIQDGEGTAGLNPFAASMVTAG